MQGQRLGVRLHPPTLGQHTQELLSGLGYTTSDIENLHRQAAVS
jgi:crotonobetainyl-CoA:carnitine CoA-transferase CaiB-like acyl-CoA transferase